MNTSSHPRLATQATFLFFFAALQAAFPGIITSIGTFPQDLQSISSGINNGGEVVGASFNSTGSNNMFLYQDGALSVIGGLPGSTFSELTAINNNGVMIGDSQNASVASEAFMNSPQGVTGLGFLPGTIPAMPTPSTPATRWRAPPADRLSNSPSAP